MPNNTSRLRGWLSPLVYLSDNWLSRTGVALVTTSGIYWLFLLPSMWVSESRHPYLGILSFLILPMGFFGGLALIPAGVFWRRRSVNTEALPPVDLHTPAVRRLLTFVGAATFVNLVIGSQLTYRAVTYMDSVGFCGQVCHSVMKPEFAAYQNSPHSRVECVACHIGPGASWFVRSKLSGVWQVFAVTFQTFERPIPTPVENLRPARETCEACHWPQRYGAEKLRVIPRYADDEANTLTKTVLLMRIGGGGGSYGQKGIHGAHLGGDVVIRYRHSDRSRQTIPWVEVSRNGTSAAYLAKDANQAAVSAMPLRQMDCMDCHNRPTHTFQIPERALDQALADESMPASLPFVRKKGLELLKASYRSGDEAQRAIPRLLADYYRSSHAAVYEGQRAAVTRAGQTLAAIYGRNVFPEMKIGWGTYPNNIGHTDFPGCFRCHDEQHIVAGGAAGGKVLGQDCSSCHQMLAMEEAAPKILEDLGLSAK